MYVLILLLCTFFQNQGAALEPLDKRICSACKREVSNGSKQLATMSIRGKNRELRCIMRETENLQEDTATNRIKDLICLGANPNILECTDAKGEYGDKRLLFVYRHDLHMASFLLQHGADPNLIGNNGCPVIFFVTQESIFQKMLAYGANIQKRGKFYKETILHNLIKIADKEFATSILQYCIENGVSVNAVDIYNQTPLHNLVYACAYHNEMSSLLTDKVSILLRSGCDVAAKNESIELARNEIVKAKKRGHFKTMNSYKQIFMMLELDRLENQQLQQIVKQQEIDSKPLLISKSKGMLCL